MNGFSPHDFFFSKPWDLETEHSSDYLFAKSMYIEASLFWG